MVVAARSRARRGSDVLLWWSMTSRLGEAEAVAVVKDEESTAVALQFEADDGVAWLAWSASHPRCSDREAARARLDVEVAEATEVRNVTMARTTLLDVAAWVEAERGEAGGSRSWSSSTVRLVEALMDREAR